MVNHPVTHIGRYRAALAAKKSQAIHHNIYNSKDTWRLGDSASMVYLAEAFDTGLNLGTDREQSYSQVTLYPWWWWVLHLYVDKTANNLKVNYWQLRWWWSWQWGWRRARCANFIQNLGSNSGTELVPAGWEGRSWSSLLSLGESCRDLLDGEWW